jgi:hypothetical protein
LRFSQRNKSDHNVCPICREYQELALEISVGLKRIDRDMAAAGDDATRRGLQQQKQQLLTLLRERRQLQDQHVTYVHKRRAPLLQVTERARAALVHSPGLTRDELAAIGDLPADIRLGWAPFRANNGILALNVDAKRALALPSLLRVNADVPFERNHYDVFGYECWTVRGVGLLVVGCFIFYFDFYSSPLAWYTAFLAHAHWYRLTTALALCTHTYTPASFLPFFCSQLLQFGNAHQHDLLP